MGIFDALTTAVSGLQSQSFALQNISGNIANSSTIAFKATDTSFEDMVSGGFAPSQQVSGSVDASSMATNSVQGSIQTSTIGTYMAINGNGYFTVAQPSGQSGSLPVFSGVQNFTRRGDFQPNQNGYLVNGAGYYLMGIPIDPTTDNPVGSQPQVLQFSNSFLPAQATTSIQYQANLAATPQTTDASSTVPGSELINPADFEANPLAGPPQPAKIIGTGAALSPDAPGIGIGTVGGLSGATTLASLGITTGDVISISDGTHTNTHTVGGTDTIATLTNAANWTGTANVAVSLLTSGANAGHLQIKGTGANSADFSVTVSDNNPTPGTDITALGFGTGNTTFAPTNLLTQSAVSSGQTLVLQATSGTAQTFTFGSGAGQIQSLAQLNAGFGAMVGANFTASANPLNGDVNVTASNPTDQLTVGGTATLSEFGIKNPLAVPSNGTVIANDNTTFLNQSLSGGSVTAYDATGAPVDIQLRWAKTNGVAEGGTDTWNLFYQVNANATGTQTAWQNVGTNFTFTASGEMSPAITTLPITNLTVNGTSLGNVTLNFGTGGITQFADTSGNVNVNALTQNGSPAGTLQTLSISVQGRIDGTFSNGRTIDLAEIPLANFAGQNNLQTLDGAAYAATPESGTPLYNDAGGTIVGSATEASNTDIADQFSQLIVTQQAYSANTKVITTADQMVQALINMIQ